MQFIVVFKINCQYLRGLLEKYLLCKKVLEKVSTLIEGVKKNFYSICKIFCFFSFTFEIFFTSSKPTFTYFWVTSQFDPQSSPLNHFPTFLNPGKVGLSFLQFSLNLLVANDDFDIQWWK